MSQVRSSLMLPISDSERSSGFMHPAETVSVSNCTPHPASGLYLENSERSNSVNVDNWDFHNGDFYQNRQPKAVVCSPIKEGFNSRFSDSRNLSPVSRQRRALLRKDFTKDWDTSVYGTTTEGSSDSSDGDSSPKTNSDSTEWTLLTDVEDGGKLPVRLLKREKEHAKQLLFFKVLMWILFLAVILCAFVGIAICTGKFVEKQGESVEHQQPFDPRDGVQTQHHQEDAGNRSSASSP